MARSALLGPPPTTRRLLASRLPRGLPRFSSTNNPEVEDDAVVDRTTFDQAGASLIEEDDQKRMEQMGDFDANPAVRSCNKLFSIGMAC